MSQHILHVSSVPYYKPLLQFSHILKKVCNVVDVFILYLDIFKIPFYNWMCSAPTSHLLRHLVVLTRDKFGKR